MLKVNPAGEVYELIPFFPHSMQSTQSSPTSPLHTFCILLHKQPHPTEHNASIHTHSSPPTYVTVAGTKMHGNGQVPIHHTPAQPERKAYKRHHTARYYVHRVRDSLTTRVSKIICAIFLGLLAILGIAAFILWISLRPHRPRFHIHEFSIPGLNQASGFQNAEIAFVVTARNPNQYMEIYYEAMDGSVYYKDQKVGSTPLLFPFYQEAKNSTVIDGELSGATLTVSSDRWEEFTSDLSKGSVVLRLELTSVIKFKVSTWQSHRHRMHANCDAGVGPDGMILAVYKDKRCPVYFS